MSSLIRRAGALVKKLDEKKKKKKIKISTAKELDRNVARFFSH